MYSVENYSNTRFNVQFNEIRNFLQKMLTLAFMSISTGNMTPNALSVCNLQAIKSHIR